MDNSASEEENKKAYHALALEHHPDLPKNAGRIQECEEMMAKINEAYEKIRKCLEVMNILDKEFLVRYEESQNSSIVWTILMTIPLKILQILCVLVTFFCLILTILTNLPFILSGIAIWNHEFWPFIIFSILGIFAVIIKEKVLDNIKTALELFLLTLKYLIKFDTIKEFITQKKKRDAFLDDFGISEKEAKHQYHIARHIFYFAKVQQACKVNPMQREAQEKLLIGLFGLDKTEINQFIFETEYNQDDLVFFSSHSREMKATEKTRFNKLLLKLAVTKERGNNNEWEKVGYFYYFAMIQKICALNESAMYSQKELLKGLFGFDKSTIQEYIYESEYTEDDLKFYGEHAKAMDFKEKKSLADLLFKLAIVQDGIHNDEWKLLMQILADLKFNNNYINLFIRRYGPLRTEFEDERKDSTSTGERTVAYLNPYYAILGLDSSASDEEIKKAYHSLALEHHPDLPKNASRIQECEEMMARINEAYDKIRN